MQAQGRRDSSLSGTGSSTGCSGSVNHQSAEEGQNVALVTGAGGNCWASNVADGSLEQAWNVAG